MTKLSKHYSKLEALLPVLTETLSGVCCENARMKLLSKMLKDLFTDLGIKYNSQKVNKNPRRYYAQFRKVILEDKSLSDVEKIKLIKMML